MLQVKIRQFSYLAYSFRRPDKCHRCHHSRRLQNHRHSDTLHLDKFAHKLALADTDWIGRSNQILDQRDQCVALISWKSIWMLMHSHGSTELTEQQRCVFLRDNFVPMCANKQQTQYFIVYQLIPLHRSLGEFDCCCGLAATIVNPAINTIASVCKWRWKNETN